MFEDIQTQPKKHTNAELYERQVRLLRTFLEHGAISQAQFDKSYHDLTEKMRITATAIAERSPASSQIPSTE